MPNDNILSGHHALVTGGSRGIGAAIAHRVAELGAMVTILGRDEEALAAEAGTLRNGRGIRCDVTNAAEISGAVGEARSRGPITILVNNAGSAESAPFLRTSDEMIERMLSVHPLAAFRFSRAVLPDMTTAKWGRIVNVASTAGLKGYRYVAAYCAAKHAVIGLTRALALETAQQGITVNAICPGFTDTDLIRRSIASVVKKTGRPESEILADITQNNPQARLVEPAEVAIVAEWLCGPHSGAITGQSIVVAGGEIM